MPQLLPSKHTALQFSKFAIVGVSNTLISLAVFYLLYNLFFVGYTAANLLSYIAGVINSFVWNKLWVFRAKEGNVLREAILFLFVFAVSYGVQYGVLHLLVEYYGINPNWAQLPAMVVYTVVNYVLNRVLTFKK